jgi:hypothetical protein
MRVIEWLYRHAAWLNLAALFAVVLWLGWAGTVLLGLPGSRSPQLQILQACPCQMPATPQRTANGG